ncbi:MAG TPA: multidrug effflux MFS transporter [Dongiaceae bacterium]|nr:multidrug effflux MFS transporter [Dongiaceae bacterium]
MHPLLLAAILAGLVAVAPFAIDTYLPALPLMAQDLGANIEWIQASIPAYLIGGAIGQFFGGPVSDQIGRKPVGLFGLLLYAVSSLLISQSESVHALLALRFTQALGGGSATVIVAAIVRDSQDGKNAARMMALIGLIMTVAPLVAPAVGSGLLLLAGWRSIFLVLALYAALMFVLLVWQVPESRARSASVSLPALLQGMVQNYSAVFRQRRALGYLLGLGFASATMFVFLSTSAFAYMEYFGASEALFPVLFGANVITMMIANRAGVVALRWFEPQLLCRVGVAVLFVSMLLLALYVGLFQPTLYVVMTLIMLGIGMMGLIYPQGMASYLHYFPKQAGAASALLGILQFTLGAASGALANVLHDGSLKPMAFGMAICASISLVGLLGISGIRSSSDEVHS